MDPPRPSLLKKRRRKGGALGRHAGGRKKKRQGSQTLVASFPAARETAASTVAIDESLDCNDNKDTVKPSNLPFIKHIRNRANYAKRKCGTKTAQINDLKARELVLKSTQTNAQEVHDASIKQTQMEMAQTLK